MCLESDAVIFVAIDFWDCRAFRLLSNTIAGEWPERVRQAIDICSLSNSLPVINDDFTFFPLTISFLIANRENLACQNLMYDRRVVRGSNFASTTNIPAAVSKPQIT